MADVPPAIERAIIQLYENERLTADLQDEAAQILLGWGADQLKAAPDPEPEQLDRFTFALHRLIRTVNQIASRQQQFSEPELVERLLKLVEQAAIYAKEKPGASPAPAGDTPTEKGGHHGQETG